jgi:hypothetical protein
MRYTLPLTLALFTFALTGSALPVDSKGDLADQDLSGLKSRNAHAISVEDDLSGLKSRDVEDDLSGLKSRNPHAISVEDDLAGLKRRDEEAEVVDLSGLKARAVDADASSSGEMVDLSGL